MQYFRNLDNEQKICENLAAAFLAVGDADSPLIKKATKI